MKPYSGGRVHVLSAMCSTCVFRPGNLMRLQPGRLAGMVDDALSEDTAIVCHSTLYGQARQEAVCRGFFDRYRSHTLPLRLAGVLDVLTFIDPPEDPDRPARA